MDCSISWARHSSILRVRGEGRGRDRSRDGGRARGQGNKIGGNRFRWRVSPYVDCYRYLYHHGRVCRMHTRKVINWGDSNEEHMETDKCRCDVFIWCSELKRIFGSKYTAARLCCAMLQTWRWIVPGPRHHFRVQCSVPVSQLMLL